MSRIWSVAVCVFIVLLALVVYYGFFRKGIVSSFNYSRVEEGMRLEQVIELLAPNGFSGPDA
jgi:hypothetical protein